MNRNVNSISGRLSLRAPQRRSLEILDRVMEIAQPHRKGDAQAALAVIRSEFPSVEDFERAFPSVCFALATGVGKTRIDGGLRHLPLRRARHPALLRARAEPHHLQQAGRRLHAEHAEICLPGGRGVRGEVAGAGDERQLRAATRRFSTCSSATTSSSMSSISRNSMFAMRMRGRSGASQSSSGSRTSTTSRRSTTSCSSWTRRIATGPTPA